MPTIHVPSSGGGLRPHRVPTGSTLALVLRDMGLLALAAQRGLEIRTASGWERVGTARVLQDGDVVRMRQPCAGSGPAGDRLAGLLQKIVGALRRKKVVPSGTPRGGVRRR